MKPHPITRTAGTSLILFSLLLSLPACSSPTADPSPAPPITSPADTSDHALRTYYESLIADLRQELLDLKESDCIARLEYESRIQELEEKLAAATQSPAKPDAPISGVPLPPTETQDESISPPSASFHYIIENDCAVICAYLGTAKAVTIPPEIVGYPVTRIADDAFKGTAVTSVIVPDTVTEIGWHAFADCTSLTSVTLPASVTSIGYGAFDGCPGLTVYCPRDSYAAQFAISFGLRVRYV